MPIDLAEALALHQRGDIERASRIYEAALAADPAHDRAFYLLGFVALQRGEFARAIELIDRAIALRPDVSDYHGAIASAYWSTRQLELAISSAREAIRLDPRNWLIRANLGTFLVAARQFTAAEEQLREAIRGKPDLTIAHTSLGHALRYQGRAESAAECFRAAVRLEPNSAEARGDLGKFLMERGDLAEALEHCREATKLQPREADAWLRLGNVHQILGQLKEAETCFRKAVEIQPSYAVAHAALGGALEERGMMEESLVTFREALRHDPNHGGVLARIATRLTHRLPEADQDAIQSLLASDRLPSDQRQQLLYGFAHVLDARGDYNRAAALSIEANARQRLEYLHRGIAFDPVSRDSEIEQIIDAFTPDFFDRLEGSGMTTERPIFIVGMPRSGTSLVEQILASHSRVFGAGELRLAAESYKSLVESLGQHPTLRDCLDHLDIEGLNRAASGHLERLDSINRTSDRIVDKMPENTIYLGLIAAMFPKARVIYCRRDSRDTALSCWMTNFGQLRWSCEAEHIQGRIIETDRLMNYWRATLRVPILEVVYEELVEDLEPKARELIAWAGLEWEPACLEFHKTRREVKTASVLQVRQPIYRSSIGRWKNYESSLAFLFDKLD